MAQSIDDLLHSDNVPALKAKIAELRVQQDQAYYPSDRVLLQRDIQHLMVRVLELHGTYWR